MMGRLVFASYRAPVILDGGPPFRAYKLLMGLSETFETTLVAFTHDYAHPGGSWSASDLAEHFPGISVVAVPAAFPATGAAKRWSQLASVASSRSWAWGRYAIPSFRRALHGAVRDSGAAIVHFNDFGVALSGPVPGAFNVYAAHNIEHRVLEGTAEAAGGIRRLFTQLDANRVRREEERVWREMDLCLGISELDAAAMAAGGARDVGVCLVGLDPVSYYELRPRTSEEPFRILFVGDGGYQPNERGIAWFVKNVFPHVRDAIPAIFDVVGRPPNRPVHAPGVTYRGYVPSLDDFYRDADVSVIPISIGSGTRGKVVEAMAYGTPVISTTLGAEGLHLEPGEHYIRADSAEEFVAGLLDLAERLRSADARLAAMLEAARASAEKHFWPNVIGDLIETYESKNDQLARPAGH